MAKDAKQVTVIENSELAKVLDDYDYAEVILFSKKRNGARRISIKKAADRKHFARILSRMLYITLS